MKATGETNPSRLGGVFSSQDTVQQARQKVLSDSAFSEGNISIIAPGETNFHQKLEPDDSGIATTLARTHVSFGIAGLIVGMIVATLLVMADISAASSSPGMVYVVFALVGPLVGMFVAGFISLRPDHDVFINRVTDAINNGKWVMVVRTHDHDESNHAKAVIKDMADTTIETM